MRSMGRAGRHAPRSASSHWISGAEAAALASISGEVSTPVTRAFGQRSLISFVTFPAPAPRSTTSAGSARSMRFRRSIAGRRRWSANLRYCAGSQAIGSSAYSLPRFGSGGQFWYRAFDALADKLLIPLASWAGPRFALNRGMAKNGGSLGVLVVEDDAPIGRMLASILADEGYVVDLAGDGLTALGKIEAREYDLILTD